MFGVGRRFRVIGLVEVGGKHPIAFTLAVTFSGLDRVLVIEERLAGTMQAATGPHGAPDQGVESQDLQQKRSGLRRLFSKVVGERTVSRDEVKPTPVAAALAPTTTPAPAPAAPVPVVEARPVPELPQTPPVPGAETTVEALAVAKVARARVAAVTKPAAAPAPAAPRPTPAAPAAIVRTSEPASPPHQPELDASSDEPAGELTKTQRVFNREAAAEEDVLPDVHPGDSVYQAACTHPMLTEEQGVQYYFSDGARSARQLVEIVRGLPDLDPRSVDLLEFASGYGRVSRHLKKYPRIKLSCCDIHEPATDFLQDALGVRSVLSDRLPEALVVPQSYDIVFALGFFTQMPRASFGRWIRALYDTLNSPGYLIFTTHGLKSCAHQGMTPAELPADGFWYRGTSEEHDLDPAEYGTSITTPDFVIGEIFRQTAAPIVEYRHGYWSGHQDLWVVKRQD